MNIPLGKTLWGVNLWETNPLRNQPTGKLSLWESFPVGNQTSGDSTL